MTLQLFILIFLQICDNYVVNIFFYFYYRYENVKFNSGGSALNTCGILKALHEEELIFFGAVGGDNNGVLLRGLLESQGLDKHLQILDKQKTGTCVCLIDGVYRCLCANIGASLHFQQQYIEEIDNKVKFSRNTGIFSPQIYYIEGYFIPQKFHICEYIYNRYCKNTENILAVNVNAGYICENFPDEIKWLVEKSDLVFCNYWELSALTTICKLKTNEDTIEYFFKKYNKRGKTKFFIITKGSENVQVYFGNSVNRSQNKFSVQPIPKQNVVDTTGAGDSFVAGFLYAYFRNQTLSECVNYGCDTAGRVITQIGCILPPESTSPSSLSDDTF